MSVTIVFDAEFGPRLVTEMVKVTLLPTRTGLVDIVSVAERSRGEENLVINAS